ncbi:hypothetical protein [Streptomyces sp. PA5.6]|uniref:hypothetical protein n=1 Tax=Streptomyces sp. PA5.6 TaxID=3035651 RepID=UPI003904CDA0
MRIRRGVPLAAVAVPAGLLLLSGCSTGASGGASSSPARAWEPDDALQRVERALDAAAEDDGAEAELSDSGTAYVGSGMDRSFAAGKGDPYRFEITCDTDGAQELTLTLSRGEEEQAYGVECGDREADQYNIPPGRGFKARVDPVKAGTGVISWRLNTIDPGDVAGCDDDIDACED